jgi:RNA 2',3'-cyclic 3'-phosphodiesterase
VPDTRRLFVAIPVPSETREQVRELIEPIRAQPFGAAPRWVHLDTLHVTLRFLGDAPVDEVPDVAQAVIAAVDGTPAFDVRLAGAGAFPVHGRKVRALWLGIAEGGPELARLSAALTERFALLGWPADVKPFAPHLTVARTDRASIADGALVSQALEAAAGDWSSTFRAQAVVLYQSTLAGGPPRHDPIETVVLRASAG